MKHIDRRQVSGELKKGSAELLILSLIEHRPRHGYEIGKLIETRSVGVLRFNLASLYPLLYRLEQRGLIKGHWVEKDRSTAEALLSANCARQKDAEASTGDVA